MNTVVVVKDCEYEKLLYRVFDLLRLTNKAFQGLKVFIKPNWVSDAPENLITSTLLIKNIVQLVKNLGARQVLVGENPTLGLKSADLYRQLGVHELVAQAGGELVLLDEEPHAVLQVETEYFKGELEVPRVVLASDFFIDVPVAKTHGQGVLSLGIKNLIGLLPDHVREREHREALHSMAVAILKVLSPKLTIVDGMIAGEGQGPASCDKFKWETLVAGRNVVAVDAVTAVCMGYDPMEVPAVRIAGAEGFGPADLNAVKILGDGIKAVQRNFRRAVASPAGRYCIPVILSGCCEGCMAWIQVRFDPWEKNGIFAALRRKHIFPVIVSGRCLEVNQIPVGEGERLLITFGDCVPAGIREQPDVVHFPGCPPTRNIKQIQEIILQKYLNDKAHKQ
jgi:uncharacterized protein (DUF362 family)